MRVQIIFKYFFSVKSDLDTVIRDYWSPFYNIISSLGFGTLVEPHNFDLVDKSFSNAGKCICYRSGVFNVFVMYFNK